ncbi:MAG: TonB-dependent receptor [Prevotella sp.]|jgi:TonB-linked SusC/RagA family outer membrane protein|nr:TonB-dependent receptor [Prevotella sp.]MCI1685910.1 TonB-dependent receptor [Prevotella sp.]MCI1781920.1 TonB-dependent receptor [Prevotella sp.]MCI1801994.1 TonB-dependent receptor [Prevotella sp.]MCI1816120.1 TonB-dependent receptor [Prevotella sp.]MCI1848330.1 TonB-dependent receptor [Prevotella sp.]
MNYKHKVVLLLVALSVSLGAFSQNLNLRFQNVTVRKAMTELKQRTGYSFVYEGTDLNTKKKVTVNAQSVNEAVKQILQGQDATYEIQGKSIIVRHQMPGSTQPRREDVQQQKSTIKASGRVTDEKGEPVIGATVMERGTSNGTVTDLDGRYSLAVPEGSDLEISYIGYKSADFRAGVSKSIVLVENSRSLNEVVVVGYGTQKKVNLTGSVSSVTFDKETLSRPITSAAAALEGASAGLEVLQSSGKPNSENFGMNVRGIGTINSSGPLVLVDGMEMSLSDVDVNNIASISILKDAASCAIYGNRGANGVILVTTKMGSKDQTRITYNMKLSWNSPTRLVKFISNYADYMGFVNEAATNVGISSIYSNETIAKWRAAEKDPDGIAESGYPNYVAYPNTNWYDWIYKTKMMQEHSVSVLGNAGHTDFNITGTYLDNPGMIVNSGVKKYNLNVNINTDITDWLQVGAHVWGFHDDQDRNDVDNLTSWGFLKTVPGIYPYYDGKYGGIEAPEEDPAAGNALLNLNGTGDAYYKHNHFYATSHAQVKFLHDFTFKTIFGYDYFQEQHKYSWIGQNTYSFSRKQYVGSAGDLNTDDVYMYNHGYNNWKWTNTLNWTHSFGKHDVSALAGFEEGKYHNNYTDVKKEGIIDPSLTDLSLVTNMKYIKGGQDENTFRSYFSRVNYAYDSKYLFEGDFRYDGSSRFSKDHRWGFFPSASAAWRISEENFVQNSFLHVFDNLKIRASVGKLGNSAVDEYAYQSVYDYAYTVMNGNKVGRLYDATLPNEDISWEKTTTYDLGLDFGVLGNRLTGTVDYYDKLTSGILYRPSIFLTLGEKNAPLQNLASIDNKGLEMTVGWNDHIRDFYYGVSGNISFNRNRVTKYKGDLVRGWKTDANGNSYYYSNIGDVSTGGINRLLKGHQLNEFYLYQTYSGSGKYFKSDGSVDPKGGPQTGMIRTENDMKWLKAMIAAGYTFLPNRNVAKNGIWYGDYIFADKNGDGVYGDSNDQDFTGCSPDPKVNFGIQMHAEWKGFDISMAWAGATGFKTFWREIGQNSSCVVFGLELPKTQAYDHYFYDPDNPTDPRTNLTSKYPRLTMNNPSQSDAFASNINLYNCNYMKLRNLTFGYTLPKYISRRFYVENLRVYVSGENLLTITPFPGLDPEMRAGAGYSIPRTMSFGLSITF